ncbi:MAG: O-methyltransferase [Muribaculaceae bacterium]|nr:O-methyltransferase [Muribaculaceae bacterium]
MEDLEEYIEAHIDAEPAALRALWRRTHLRHVYPRMCSGHTQGRLLKMLAALAAPRRAVELGTFTGYSALCLAEGMAPGTELHTIEIDDEMEPELSELFAAPHPGADITLHIGDALQVLPQLPGPWDLAFIDANKRHYSDYYELLLPRMSRGGLILADNTLWSGKILHPEAARDPQTRALLEFNDLVAADPRVETVILPVRDGLTMLRVV